MMERHAVEFFIDGVRVATVYADALVRRDAVWDAAGIRGGLADAADAAARAVGGRLSWDSTRWGEHQDRSGP